MEHIGYELDLTEQEKINVRRYCWYPARGNNESGSDSLLYFSHYGAFEYRLRHLAAGEAEIVRTMLSRLESLENGPASASANLDTDKAASWTRNRTEVRDRIVLFNQQRLELANFLGMEPGPGWRGNSVRFVV